MEVLATTAQINLAVRVLLLRLVAVGVVVRQQGELVLVKMPRQILAQVAVVAMVLVPLVVLAGLLVDTLKNILPPQVPLILMP
jgi:hypothetical protein